MALLSKQLFVLNQKYLYTHEIFLDIFQPMIRQFEQVLDILIFLKRNIFCIILYTQSSKNFKMNLKYLLAIIFPISIGRYLYQWIDFWNKVSSIFYVYIIDVFIKFRVISLFMIIYCHMSFYSYYIGLFTLIWTEFLFFCYKYIFKSKTDAKLKTISFQKKFYSIKMIWSYIIN